MAEDWLADVRKYVSDADEGVVGAIVRYCGIALRNRDSSLVSFSDKKETDRVRENFLKKKLGLTQDDSVLDAAIASVGERMKADRTKNRVTVYYLLADHFGRFDLFGGVAKAAGAAAAGAAALGAAAIAAAKDGPDGDAETGAPAAPLAAAGLGGASATAGAPKASVSPASPSPTVEPVRVASPTGSSGGSYAASDEGDSGGGMGWLPWLLLALLLAAILFFALRGCSHDPAQPVAGADATAAAGADGANAAGAVDAGNASATAAPAPVPEGAGVVAAERDSKPMLTVYFDTGKSDVSNDLTAAASAVKAYVDANPAATLAVSGYNDPTGNAAINAALSKKRAQAVKAAIEKLGVPAEKVLLEKPAETTDASGDNSAARRVEVTIKE